jgi:hypothetical protein
VPFKAEYLSTALEVPLELQFHLVGDMIEELDFLLDSVNESVDLVLVGDALGNLVDDVVVDVE